MKNTRKLDLESSVPPEPGITIRLQYKFDGEFGDALLLRTPTDGNPVQISAPGGEVGIRLTDPQTLYVQVLDGSSSVSISPIGYDLP